MRAILQCNPQFPTSDIEVFACGSTLGHLLRFVRSIDKPFKFAVEVIGNTVFFVRKESSPKELIKDVRGFGHSFPEAYTSWDPEVAGSETHQRLIQYDLGGIKCVVRFEVDGYLQDKAQVVLKAPSLNVHTPSHVDDLASALGAASISRPLSSSSETLNVRINGSEVPQNSIFDLKTRSGRKNREIDMGDLLPVLWLKQFQNFIVAYHDGAGLFKDVRVQDITEDLRAWQDENRPALKRFVTLLGKIIEIAKDDEKGRLEVRCRSLDRLEIRRQHGDGEETLPAALKEQWERISSGSDDEEEEDRLKEEPHDGPDLRIYDSDENEEDYTACSADSCGYCGRCSY